MSSAVIFILIFIVFAAIGEIIIILMKRTYPRWFAITLIWQQRGCGTVNVLTICRLGYKLEDMKESWLNWLKADKPDDKYYGHQVTVVEVK